MQVAKRLQKTNSVINLFSKPANDNHYLRLLWQSSKDQGQYAENVNHVEITKGGDLVIPPIFSRIFK